MHITNIKAQNFRLIKNVNLELDEKKQDLSLLIGRNNSGKTSFIVLLEKFVSSASPDFCFDDFPIALRSELLGLNEESDIQKLTISLLLDIHYDEADSLDNISDFILDLDPELTGVKILFECKIKKEKLLTALDEIKDRKSEYIKKHINRFLETNIYALNDESDKELNNRHKLAKKEWSSVNNLINLQVIHAKRNVASSESNHRSPQVLSGLATSYFNKDNKLSHDDQNGINQSILDMDATLDGKYKVYFNEFLQTAKDFLEIKDLKIVSDLQSKEILSNHSKLVYGDKLAQLPEHLNGLGHMNILYLLLQIEIKKNMFDQENKDINLLFIEEPEAHTHPQMQYVFINKIKALLKEIPHLQTMISTHSSHIVNKCNFKEIRYFLKCNKLDEIIIKNFHSELSKSYRDDDPDKNTAEKANFQFLQQYLTLNSSELFFAEKIIFIEGTTEKLLLPLFIKAIDDENSADNTFPQLSSQNISILEVGANSKAFRHFINFLEIKTLIITDIDTTKKVAAPQKNEPEKSKTTYPASPVAEGSHTSNYSLEYFLNAPKRESVEYNQWIDKLKKNQLQSDEYTLKLAYQIEENNYHGRSFEDAFISMNFDKIMLNKDKLEGLQHKKEIKMDHIGFYELTDKILKEKSSFASSLLWLALSERVEWKIPAYIKEGLLWIAK